MEVTEREARALVREEERRAKAREEQEERMIQQQMKALRYRWGLLAIIISSVSVHRYKFENGCAYPLDIGISSIPMISQSKIVIRGHSKPFSHFPDNIDKGGVIS